jgi:hypothetical protein
MRLSLSVGSVLLALTGCAVTSAPSSDATANAERTAATADITAAIQRHDNRQAVAIENGWARRHPMDLDFRHLEPLLYLMAGDSAGWEHARGDLLQSWKRIRDTAPPPADPSFTIDMFKVGQDVIVADQCYERGGRFGVIYRFTVVSPDRHVNSFFTVESPDSDNMIARELGRGEQVFTLDHFRPGVHETVAMLPGLPAYENLRQRVLAYAVNPHPISASSNGQAALSTEGCSINR